MSIFQQLVNQLCNNSIEMLKQAKLLYVQETKLKEHDKYLTITLEEVKGHIRQIVIYICIK